MDEFAEWHAKDLVVRESLVGSVPSAGVGTCFSRRALLALNAETDNQPFNTESLTEDYDVGARLGKMGMQSIFARFPVQFATRRKAWFGLGKADGVGDDVGDAGGLAFRFAAFHKFADPLDDHAGPHSLLRRLFENW